MTLSKIGSVKMVYHRPIKGKHQNVYHPSVLARANGMSRFRLNVSLNACQKRPEQVGIDVGLKTFATLSNGEEIANPRFFRKEEKALATVQRKHSKLAKGTPERRKHRKVVARVHERIAFRTG